MFFFFIHFHTHLINCTYRRCVFDSIGHLPKTETKYCNENVFALKDYFMTVFVLLDKCSGTARPCWLWVDFDFDDVIISVERQVLVYNSTLEKLFMMKTSK